MSADKSKRVYGAERATGVFENIDGINCEIIKKHFPVDKTDGPWRWYNAYRFTAPGWEECTIVGRAAAKRVISGRTDPAVLNTLGINPYGKYEQTRRNLPKTEADEPERASVLRTIQESRDAPSRSAPQTRSMRDSKSKYQGFQPE
jgi:hypothetical protein